MEENEETNTNFQQNYKKRTAKDNSNYYLYYSGFQEQFVKFLKSEYGF